MSRLTFEDDVYRGKGVIEHVVPGNRTNLPVDHSGCLLHALIFNCRTGCVETHTGKVVCYFCNGPSAFSLTRHAPDCPYLAAVRELDPLSILAEEPAWSKLPKVEEE